MLQCLSMHSVGEDTFNSAVMNFSYSCHVGTIPYSQAYDESNCPIGPNVQHVPSPSCTTLPSFLSHAFVVDAFT
jgi:hypothetical protein